MTAAMRLFKRLFPGKEVRAALSSIDGLERTLRDTDFVLADGDVNAFGPLFGFRAIKDQIRRRVLDNPDALRSTQEKTGRSIEVLVMILARNVAWEELWSGRHVLLYRPSMTGDGLISLYSHLTSLLEQAGVETKEEAAASRASLREMMQERFAVAVRP